MFIKLQEVKFQIPL